MLKFTIKNLEINPCIMNASGPKCITEEDLTSLAMSEVGAIVTKSMTALSREGNHLPRYHANNLGSINSTGLANLGYKEYVSLIPKIKAKTSKPIIASIAGLCYDDFIVMCKELNKVADALEVNLSCPNVIGKPQIGYDFDASEKLLTELRSIISKPMGVKLPPYLDPVHRKSMSDILLKTGVDSATLINSIGHSLIIDPETEQTTISPNNGLGGLGGKYVKPVTLGNLLGFHKLLKGRIPLIGAGGIYSGSDAYEHFLAGASAVQIGTAYQEEGVGVFARVKSELFQLLKSKNVSDIKQKIGMLKILPASG